MLTPAENQLLTRTGPGTPMGALMRRYWIPALFSDAVAEPDGPPVRVKLMGERLVAFRDTMGRVGLLDERCPHRTASLFFGRNEECGLRCVYHGWKFDIDGNCVDQPSEPDGSNFKDKVKQRAYPCLERGGVVWTYMGPPALRPPFPELEWTQVPASHRFVTRHLQECNWLQALEGGFDTSHLTFLHSGAARALDGRAMRLPSRYDVIPADFGFIAGTGRETEDGGMNWTANVMLLPFHKLIATNPIGAHAWVPIDDDNTINWCIDYRPDRPLAEAELAYSKSWHNIHAEQVPGSDRAALNRDNEYGIDRALQKSGRSYTGIKGIGMQDCSIQESMGPVADRSIEHLGVSDTIIIKLRRLLLETLKQHDAGAKLAGLDPESYRVRSARFTVPREQSFADAAGPFVRIADPVPAK
ncbi:MAG TPA: Rieske 2Fe-2S domain-containing protein [Stellaceae bacterium]|nr:Rieske 2Fe-2S domain-containing protein [Stellaceae bacterium]